MCLIIGLFDIGLFDIGLFVSYYMGGLLSRCPKF